MSLKYPRRVKDLPRLETDSEDEPNTPLKERNKNVAASVPHESIAYCNKENEVNITNSAKSSNNAFCKFRNPKRRSELPAMESDSDPDDNLNCAILNDSFLMSPGQNDKDDSVSASENEHDCNDRHAKEDTKTEVTATNQSLLARFDKMVLGNDATAVGTVSTPSVELCRKAAAPQTITKTASKDIKNSVCNLVSIEEDKEIATVRRFHSEPEAVQHHSLKEHETSTCATSTNTTSADAQFVTPQIRSFSVQRRPRDICSTQSQKTRSAIVNEFRSQKVLFQTPMAMTRAAPISSNDSITLSLCDSISDHQGGTPITSEKASPPPNATAKETASTAKAKKSLDGAFKDFGVELPNGLSVTEDRLSGSAASCEAVPPMTPSTNNTAAVASTSKAKQTILEINNLKYIILQKLGSGGSSSVYLAQRQDNGKECALKIVDLRGDLAVVTGYLNETKLLHKLQGNICVVSLFDYQLLAKEFKLYLVMEKGDSDLHKVLQGYKTNLPLYVLMNFWYQMLQAVNYIHQNGVIHSDLKPANFLLVNGRLKLIDFGIASNIAVDSTSIIKFSQAGTFNYISPEALTDTSTGSSPVRTQPKIKISTKSDVWSLGCILYLLLYKKTPFSHILNIYAKISAISSPTPSIVYPTLPPYYPDMLLHMVKSCLQHNPKKRPSCSDLLQYPFHMVIPVKNLNIPSK